MNDYSNYQYSNNFYGNNGISKDFNLLKNNNLINNNIYQQRINQRQKLNIKKDIYSMTDPDFEESEFSKKINYNLRILQNTLNKTNNKNQNISNQINKNEYIKYPIQEIKRNYKKNNDTLEYKNNDYILNNQNINNYILQNNYTRNTNFQINNYRQSYPIQSKNINNDILNMNNNYSNNKRILNNNIQRNINKQRNNYLNKSKTTYNNNPNNFYKYINTNKKHPIEHLRTNSLSNQSSFSNLMDYHINLNESRDISTDKKNNNYLQREIPTPNLNNYQNNYYIQYTTPRRKDEFNFNSNNYNNNINDNIENDSINLSILADTIIECFDLDKKESENNVLLIEESPFQIKNDYIKNNKRNYKSFEDNKINDIMKKNDNFKVNLPLNINQKNNLNFKDNKINGNYYLDNKNSMNDLNKENSKKLIINYKQNNENLIVKNPINNNKSNYENLINFPNDKLNNEKIINKKNSLSQNDIMLNQNVLNNIDIKKSYLEGEKYSKKKEKKKIIQNEPIIKKEEDQYNFYSRYNNNYDMDDNKKTININSYLIEDNTQNKKIINERYEPINSVILEVSECKETSMMNSKLDQSVLKNSSIILSNSLVKDLNEKKNNSINKISEPDKVNDIEKNPFELKISVIKKSEENKNEDLNKNINIKNPFEVNNNKNNNNINNINNNNNSINNNNNNNNINGINIVNNKSSTFISESFLNDSDEENNEVLKEIIRTAKIRDLKEKKKKMNKLKNVKFETNKNVNLIYNEDDNITKMNIYDCETNTKKELIPKDFSFYKYNILQNANKPKSILKEFNKNEILIDNNFVFDYDYIINYNIDSENEEEKIR